MSTASIEYVAEIDPAARAALEELSDLLPELGKDCVQRLEARLDGLARGWRSALEAASLAPNQGGALSIGIGRTQDVLDVLAAARAAKADVDRSVSHGSP